jgi:hypothetical protein
MKLLIPKHNKESPISPTDKPKLVLPVNPHQISSVKPNKLRHPTPQKTRGRFSMAVQRLSTHIKLINGKYTVSS